MILLREVNEKDLDDLLKLSQEAAERHPGFINLSTDADVWIEKIKTSIDSFSNKKVNKAHAKYIFVAEDLNEKTVVGVSMISAQHGTEEIPHFYFQIEFENKFSQTINTGFIHSTLQLKQETCGPTEIGGLMVLPQYRGSGKKIGKQISFVRFLYIAINKNRFQSELLSELLPPLTKRGKAALWEAIGRRFTNLDYPEADALSMKNKEFIDSLFPKEKIYTTLLTAEARNAIGKVSKDTEPVLHLLKSIGFKYLNQVDPFDGGPHLRAKVDEVKIIKNIKNLKAEVCKGPVSASFKGLITKKDSRPFKSILISAEIEDIKIKISSAEAEILDIKNNDEVYFMDFE